MHFNILKKHKNYYKHKIKLKMINKILKDYLLLLIII